MTSVTFFVYPESREYLMFFQDEGALNTSYTYRFFCLLVLCTVVFLVFCNRYLFFEQTAWKCWNICIIFKIVVNNSVNMFCPFKIECIWLIYTIVIPSLLFRGIFKEVDKVKSKTLLLEVEVMYLTSILCLDHCKYIRINLRKKCVGLFIVNCKLYEWVN